MLNESLSVPQSRVAMKGPHRLRAAAVPIMIMNVRINDSNVTIMTAIFRMKKRKKKMMMR